MGKGGQKPSTTTTAPIKETASKQPPAGLLDRVKKLIGIPELPEEEWVAPCSKWDEAKWKSVKFPTKSELRAVIPPHCFERSALTGFAYILRDLAMLVTVVTIARTLGLSAQVPSDWLSFAGWCVAWFVYSFLAAICAAGLWVIGHECGHGAFSEYPLLNDTVGFVIHTMFLVPYFAWQYSHAKHHKRTNHLTEGESHVPDTFGDRICQFHYQVFNFLGEEGFTKYNTLVFHAILLFPLYMLGLNSGARVQGCGHDPAKPCTTYPDHFRPNSALYHDANDLVRSKILLSDIGLLAWMSVLALCASKFGILSVLLWYECPNLIVNHVSLVWLTWIQHTHPSVPHFGDDEWTWVKATLLGTVDHYYLWWVETCSHHIGSTHVCHHLFDKIPFYHAQEATAALKEYLEPMELYNYDPGLSWAAIRKAGQTCHYVEGTKGIQFYKSFKDVQKEEPKKKV